MKTNRSNMTFLDVAEDWKLNPRVPVESTEQLRNLLAQLSKQEPRIVEFESGAGDRLQIGIGGPFACAQFTKHDNMPPYFCAKTKVIRAKDDVEFLLGGTPTPVDPEQCLSFEEVIEIVEHFFETGDCCPEFEWVEV